jgi:hypothetical protein
LVAGGAVPEEHGVLGDVIKAAHFFDAAKVLDTLLKHVGEIAAVAAAAPPANPYATMLGIGDPASSANQIRMLIQDIRTTEPALAERIKRAVCGGDAVNWTTPGGAYVTVVGNAYLKSIAAEMAGGTLVLSADGAAETVDGVAVGSLALQHAIASKIEKTEFCWKEDDSDADSDADDGVDGQASLTGTIDSVISVSCHSKPEESVYPGSDKECTDYGFPAVKKISLEVGCTLTVAAGAATCVATLKLLASAQPGWRLNDEYVDSGQVKSRHRRIDGIEWPRLKLTEIPQLKFEVEIRDGNVSMNEMEALDFPYDECVDIIECGKVDAFTQRQYPLFAVLAQQAMDAMWL